jgi:hypothetical protein
MKRTAIAIVLLVVAVLAAACDTFLSPQPSNSPQAPVANTLAAPGQATLPVPVGACQSRLWGKVTNAATGKSPANVAVEISSSGKTFKTVTDANGLYGFAGLCAGEYAMSLTPPGGKPIPNPNPVKLDGKQVQQVDLPYK